MTVYKIDPTRDERWDEFLQNHPDSSVFHTRGWLEALRRTYGYQPVAFTLSPPGHPLTNAVPFCQISSWLFGTAWCRCHSPTTAHRWSSTRNNWPPYYFACGRNSAARSGATSRSDLRTQLAEPARLLGKVRLSVFTSWTCVPDWMTSSTIFTKTACRGRFGARCERVSHARREDPTRWSTTFYQLLLTTRRKHGLPAQPVEWFRNLIACVGDKAKIRVAFKDGRPIASIFTLRHKQVLVYKYGCSDRRFSNLGGTQLLLWNAIQEAKMSQLSEFDLGRSDRDNPGLLVFKDRWGAGRTPLTYLRYPVRSPFDILGGTQASIGKYVWSHAPSSVLAVAGRVLYKYMG